MQNIHFYTDLEMHNSTLRFELRVKFYDKIILCTQAEIFSSYLLTYWTDNFFLLSLAAAKQSQQYLWIEG